MPAIEKTVVTPCSLCGRTKRTKPSKDGGIKLPLGWKRLEDKPVCDTCWKSRYLLRALTFAVASPLTGAWKDLETDLRGMWAVTTQMSNWMMTQCYVRDIRREAGEEKMPPMPPVYLYPEARILFPGLPPRSVASLEQAVKRKYRAKRYDVVWRSAASLSTMRYPQPYPIPNQGWSYRFENNNPVVSLRIGEKNWELRLKSGARYYRQIDGLKRMAQRGEMAIYKTGDGTLLVKLVGWLARPPERKKGEGTLIVRTGKDHLLAALDIKGERIWTENCDHLARWIAEHRRRLNRYSEDQKAEQRPVAAFSERRKAMVDRQRHRIESAIQEIAAHLVNFAVRRKYAAISYNSSERWLSEFPYFLLEERIKVKVDEAGILFEKVASGAATPESGEPLAEE